VENDAYIAIGSNQGDRELYLLRAVAEIGKIAETRVTGLSPFYETTPVGVTDQPNFFNAVLRLSTRLSPHDLLKELQNIEDNVFKRNRTVKWGPRNIDLDILLYGEMVLNSPELIIPHPHMLERRFVLEPLNALAPEFKHPGDGRTIRQLLMSLKTDEIVVRI
jgi:2-amino-4-hydroxy-6-hydroxymethyldihydropteridine diphosphokinase